MSPVFLADFSTVHFDRICQKKEIFVIILFFKMSGKNTNNKEVPVKKQDRKTYHLAYKLL